MEPIAKPKVDLPEEQALDIPVGPRHERSATPIQVSEKIWIYSHSDLPAFVREELNRGIGVYVIEPDNLNRNPADHPRKPGSLVSGFKALRPGESVLVDQLADRFSPAALTDLRITREGDGTVKVWSSAAGASELKLGQPGISDVTALSHPCPVSQRAGFADSYTAHFQLPYGTAELGLQLEPDMLQELLVPIDSDLFEAEPGRKQAFDRTCEAVLNYCCERLGLPPELRPRLRFEEMEPYGAYRSEPNEMLVRDFGRPGRYGESAVLIEVLQVIAHETFHASRMLALKAMLGDSTLRDEMIGELKTQPVERITPSLAQVADPVAAARISGVVREILDDPRSKAIFGGYTKARFTETPEIREIDRQLREALGSEALASDPLLVHKLRDEISFIVHTATVMSAPAPKSFQEIFGRAPSEGELTAARGYLKEMVDFTLAARGHGTSEACTPQSLRDEVHYYFVGEEVGARNFQIEAAKLMLEPLLVPQPGETPDIGAQRRLRKATRWNEELSVRQVLNNECFELLGLRRGNAEMLGSQDTAERIESITTLNERLDTLSTSRFSESIIAQNLLDMLRPDLSRA